MSELDDRTRRFRLAGLLSGFVFGLVVFLALCSAWFPSLGLSLFFQTVCHQQLDRSHVIDGAPVAVCIRCFWLYVGLFIGHARFVVSPSVPSFRYGLLISAAALSLVSWLGGWAGFVQADVSIRITTSLILGISISHYTVPGIVELLFTKQNSTHNLSPIYGNNRN